MGTPPAAPTQRTPRKNPLILLSVAAALIFVAWPRWPKSPYLPWQRHDPHPSTDTGVQWKPCWQDPEFSCGVIEVPTDYQNISAGKTRIPLTKLPATSSKEERQGIILIHYGGPGIAGVESSFESARGFRELTGGHHDIISFDQRGQGRAEPNVNCFGSKRAYSEFQANTVFETTFSVPTDPFSEGGKAVLVEQQKQALVLEETQAAVCGRTVGADVLGYMSTTATIYDMEEISRVLEGEDALINFYGGSYGSVVGQYLVNMLPHKAGRVSFTGNLPADIWANNHYESQHMVRFLLTDAEKTYTFFMNECFEAGPKHCSLAHEGDVSAQNIQDRVDAFLDRLQEQPLMVPKATRPGYLTSGGVRSTLYTAISYPAFVSVFFDAIAHAMDGDGTDLFALLGNVIDSPTADPEPDQDGYLNFGQASLRRLAISCGDALPRAQGEHIPSAEDIVDDILVTLRDVSPRFGATIHMMEQHGGCHYWPGTGVGPERYRGPWNAQHARDTHPDHLQPLRPKHASSRRHPHSKHHGGRQFAPPHPRHRRARVSRHRH
uniref:AB hydrolase-1 domain-containing protein n=1 Tax=Mycena chlorophos TaxID=658473 RepID=A0ABQ0LEH6_MYCCL|nr:predicted protein [Mycena chlorophos]